MASARSLAAAFEGLFRRDAARTGNIPWRYALHIAGAVLLQLALVGMLIEGIYLAEKFVGIMERTILANGSMAQVFVILGLTTPEVFDLALAAALLIAVYRVALRLREDRELVILAGMGVGAERLVLLMAAIGAVAAIVSIAVSGFINPYAQFAQRSITFHTSYNTLRGGIASGKVAGIQDYVIRPGRVATDNGERGVFLYRRMNDETDRMVLAKRASWQEDTLGWFTLKLHDFEVYDFPSARTIRGVDEGVAASDPSAGNVASMRIGNFEQQLALDNLIRFEPRGAQIGERTMIDLVAAGDNVESGRRIARSVLCLLAPPLALFALVMTTATTQIFILPLAVLTLMTFDIAAVAMARTLAPMGLSVSATAIVVLLAAGLAVFAHQTIRRQFALLRPALNRG